MNFGEILDKWELATMASGVRTEKNAHTSKIINEWLQNNEIYDKDAHEIKKTAPGENRRRLLRNEPDNTLDIHGLTSKEAWLSLDRFFTNANNSGYRKLRVIHGKGNNSNGEAVLRRIVREYIEKCPFAGESGYEKSINGGTGATWVFLK